MLLEHLHSHEIKDWDDICWIVFQLLVERLVELKDMAAIYIKGVLLGLSYLFEQIDVVRLLVHVLIFSVLAVHVMVVVLDDRERGQEVFQLRLEVGGVDVCSPQNLSI